MWAVQAVLVRIINTSDIVDIQRCLRWESGIQDAQDFGDVFVKILNIYISHDGYPFCATGQHYSADAGCMEKCRFYAEHQ